MADKVEAPWEKEGEEFDAERAKAHLTRLLDDKARLQERLRDAGNAKKDSSNETEELRKENLLLKVQMKTGLSDRNLSRLVGTTEEELLEDAELFAEETGIELRSFIDPTAGTPGDESGADDEGEGKEQEKSFSTSYRTPGGQSLAGRDEPDFAGIIEGLEIG